MIYVFTGPTLSPQEAARELDAVFLPPAAQGDIYRAALERPEAIGLIDGYFDDVPAVWHKEILWAMSEGIHVFGGASMGALRAAELAPFGMQGVGAIFEAFQSGELEDDDEVAVAHASAEDGFRPLSEAMVNIRATLKSAERAGLLGTAVHSALVRLAKALLYPERSWPALFAQATREGLPPDELRRLREWLPRGRVDQKRTDALALLHGLRDHQTARPGAKQVTYAFAHTDAWEESCRSTRRLSEGKSERESLARESLLEELRVSGLLPRVRAGALARALALEEARRLGDTVDSEGLRETCEAFRREKGLLTQQQFERWVVEQRLEAPVRFFEDEARVRRVEVLLESEVLRCLPDHLRARGVYGALLGRLEDKAGVLAGLGLERPGLDEAGLTEDELWEWYFTDRLDRPVPADLERFSREAGFASVDALRRAVLREYCYLQEVLENEAGTSPS